MTKYREIIRLTGLGFSQRDIMASCGVAQKTVVKVQKRARELKLSWPLDEALTDTELQKLMFSKENKVLSGKLNDASSGRLFRADFRTLQMCQSL